MRVAKEMWDGVSEGVGRGTSAGGRYGNARPPAGRAELISGLLRDSLSADSEAFNESIVQEEGE